jgi:hypothetical protein
MVPTIRSNCSARGRIGLGEDGLESGDDHVGVGPLHPGQHVAHEVHPAPLPGRTHHHRLNGLLQAQVLIRDDQADSFQPPGPKRPQELGPKGPVLGVADGTAQDLPVPVHRHPGRHHHRPGDDLMVDPALQVGGV